MRFIGIKSALVRCGVVCAARSLMGPEVAQYYSANVKLRQLSCLHNKNVLCLGYYNKI